MGVDKFKIVEASEKQLDIVLGWLETEYAQDGEGFWSNRGIIASAQAKMEMNVALDGSVPVGFSVGRYGEDIVCVKQDYRGQGIGTALFNYCFNDAVRDGVPVLRVECAPDSSLTFWLKQGFEQYGVSHSMWANPLVRRVMSYDLPLPQLGTPCRVLIGFWPEHVLYDPDSPAPGFEVYEPKAVRSDDGIIHLASRCIGISDWDGHKDLAIGIAVDGEKVCLTKAKYEEAKALGVRRHVHGGDFYIDRIYLKPASGQETLI